MTPSLLLLLTACTGAPAPSPAASPGRTPVRVALNWVPEPEFGGFYEALLSGAYAARGLDVTLLPGGPGAPTLELLESGKAEVALTAADDLLVKRARGVRAVGVFPSFQDSPAGLMVHASSGITRFEDIAARPSPRVALEIGAPFATFLWARFGWEGKVAQVPTSGGIGAFLADPAAIQQAYITAEPCVARSRGVDTVFLPAASAGWNPYAALAAVADPPPPWADDFIAATLDGWRAYLQSPDRANAEIARLNPDLPAAVLGCVTEAQRPYVRGTGGLGALTAARMAEIGAALQAQGLLPAGTDAASAILPRAGDAAP